MNRLILASGIAILAFGGCGQPTPQEIDDLNAYLEAGFKRELNIYFNRLNNEGNERKEMLRLQERMSQDNPTLHRAQGLTYHTYLWEPDGFLVYDYPCKVCNAKLLLHFNNPVAETYLCPACRHSPYKAHRSTDDLRISPCTQCVGTESKPTEPDRTRFTKKWFEDNGKGTVAAMYEITERPTQDKPDAVLLAKIRYIRKAWTYDNLGILKVPPAAVERAASKTEFVPTRGVRMELDPKTGRPMPQYNLQGFHRLDGTYAGELEMRYEGGKITILSKRPKEVPVRPWQDIPRKNAEVSGR